MKFLLSNLKLRPLYHKEIGEKKFGKARSQQTRQACQQQKNSPGKIEAVLMHACYCSICFARKPAAVSAIFISRSLILVDSFLFRRITEPIGSPRPRWERRRTSRMSRSYRGKSHKYRRFSPVGFCVPPNIFPQCCQWLFPGTLFRCPSYGDDGIPI